MSALSFVLALATSTSTSAPAASAEEGAAAFLEVVTVLQHARCQNCHPKGDRPLQTDRGRPHAMNVSRRSLQAGMPCRTCHQETNADAMGIEGGPPGAPHWGLPPADTPMVFEGRTPAELCAQLNRSEDTGGRTLDDLLEHVREDALVKWGWSPGADRSTPPLDHATFVDRFATWVASGGACPDD